MQQPHLSTGEPAHQLRRGGQGQGLDAVHSGAVVGLGCFSDRSARHRCDRRRGDADRSPTCRRSAVADLRSALTCHQRPDPVGLGRWLTETTVSVPNWSSTLCDLGAFVYQPADKRRRTRRKVQRESDFSLCAVGDELLARVGVCSLARLLREGYRPTTVGSSWQLAGYYGRSSPNVGAGGLMWSDRVLLIFVVAKIITEDPR